MHWVSKLRQTENLAKYLPGSDDELPSDDDSEGEEM